MMHRIPAASSLPHLSFSARPSGSFFPATSFPRLKERKKKQKQRGKTTLACFSSSTLHYYLHLSLPSATNRSVSPHLCAPLSLFLTRICLPSSFDLSCRLIPPSSPSFLPLFSSADSHTHAHTCQEPCHSRQRRLPVYLFRPNTYATVHTSIFLFLQLLSHILYTNLIHFVLSSNIQSTPNHKLCISCNILFYYFKTPPVYPLFPSLHYLLPLHLLLLLFFLLLVFFHPVPKYDHGQRIGRL